MYKIFVNEKPLIISKEESKEGKNISYNDKNSFDLAFDLLYNTPENSVTIFYFDQEIVWNKLQEYAVPVYAAGGIVKNNEDKYLFIKRNGIWDLPKGHVEKGENYEQAAIREVEEECSITNLKLGKLISITYHVYFDKKYILKVVYWYAMDYSDSAAPIPQSEENINIADWFSIDEIPTLLKNTYGNIKNLVTEHILKV